MKKFTVLFVTLAFVMISTMAWAIPTTWTDVIDFNPDVKIPPAYSYTHNIADNGFSSFLMGGNDTISSYELTVALYDDKLGTTGIFGIIFPDLGEGASILTTGGVYTYNFALTSQTYTGNVFGTLDLFADGKFGVGISPLFGDFVLASSSLTAYGDNGSAPVPEPGTMMLLGAGLLGLAVYGKRRMNKA